MTSSPSEPGVQGEVGPQTRQFNAARAICVALAVAGAAGPGAALAEPLRLLALGDSLTAGYGLPEAEAFTTRLEQALRAAGYDVEVLNGGVSGDTTAGGLARIDWALADRPDAVLLELGANDGLRGIDPASTRDNLAAILARLEDAGVPVLLAGMYAPPNLGPVYGESFNAIYPDLARQFDVPLYPFFLDGVAAVPGLNQADGIHPNAEGVDVIVAALLGHVAGLLDTVPAEGSPDD
ncbi:MAG: arylesterase [Rhodospirillaceae bacterium]|nr:arylesterase [Rhodospirillaceae bacterium]